MERFSSYRTDGPPSFDASGTPRELEVLGLLQTYDLLPSHYIRTALGNSGYVPDLLTNLRKGHYIGFPEMEPEERLAHILRNRKYVNQIWPRGEALLARHGLWHGKPRGNDHFKHKLLRSQIEFSLDWAAYEVPDLRVITPAEVLAHKNCPPATREDKTPWRIPPKPCLEPDITRGYALDGHFIFFHVEVDRNTEPGDSESKRQSIRDKIQRYVAYLRAPNRFGFKSEPFILFATIDAARKEVIETLITKQGGEYADCFRTRLLPMRLEPDASMATMPWGDLHLINFLKENRSGLPGQSRPR
jgi:hypothetical protein